MLGRVLGWDRLVEIRRNPRQALARGNIELWANLLIIGCAVAFMLWKGATFATTLGTVFAIWGMLSVSLNLVVGYSGLLSIGHIGFFGLGAYSVAILTSTASYEQLRTGAIPTFGWPFFAALPVAIVVTGVVALLVGIAFNRFRDDIYVLVSFGFAIIAFNVFLSFRGTYQGSLRHCPNRQTPNRQLGVRYRAGTYGVGPGFPGRGCRYFLVHSVQFFWASAYRYPGR